MNLSKSEIQTLISMARVCRSAEDFEDALYLFSLLPEESKPQLKEALKKLPAKTKRLMHDAATSLRAEGVAA